MQNDMTLNEYQEMTANTAVYRDTVAPGDHLTYATLGLVGESCEFAEKIKKILRDEGGFVSPEKVEELKAELGDVLWYLARLATELGASLGAVAEGNIEKLYSRKDRGTLHGSGDDR